LTGSRRVYVLESSPAARTGRGRCRGAVGRGRRPRRLRRAGGQRGAMVGAF